MNRIHSNASRVLIASFPKSLVKCSFRLSHVELHSLIHVGVCHVSEVIVLNKDAQQFLISQAQPRIWNTVCQNVTIEGGEKFVGSLGFIMWSQNGGMLSRVDTHGPE